MCPTAFDYFPDPSAPDASGLSAAFNGEDESIRAGAQAVELFRRV